MLPGWPEDVNPLGISLICRAPFFAASLLRKWGYPHLRGSGEGAGPARAFEDVLVHCYYRGVDHLAVEREHATGVCLCSFPCLDDA